MPEGIPSLTAQEVVALLAQIVPQLLAHITPTSPPEAIDRAGLAQMLSVGITKIDDWNTRGLLPEPIQLGDSGRCPRWLRTDLLAWLSAGAPCRAKWTLVRQQQERRRSA